MDGSSIDNCGNLTQKRQTKLGTQPNAVLQPPCYYHTDDLDPTIETNTKRYNNRVASSPLFPHFPPPPEYPPPSSEHQSNAKFANTLHCLSSYQYHDDADCIEICIEHDPPNDCTGRSRGKPKVKPRTSVNYAKNAYQMGNITSSSESSQMTKTWNRNNIAATMERYEPTMVTSSSSHGVSSPATAQTPPLTHSPLTAPVDGYHSNEHRNGGGNSSQHDYAYAYYEPGRVMRHTNVPNGVVQDPGPSRPPPPNSIRALLNTASRKNSPNGRHRYGTQENIYEEISNDPRLRFLSAGSSMVSLNQNSLVEEEFRRIQSRHRRILGELNLSVEAMLMPESPQQSPTREPPDQNDGEHLSELLNSVGPTDELLSPVSTSVTNGDMDSGFSGSSSSASYVGSLRYHRNGNGSQTRSSTPGAGNNSSSYSGSIRSSQRSNEDPGIPSSTSRSFNSVYETKGEHLNQQHHPPQSSGGITHYHQHCHSNSSSGSGKKPSSDDGDSKQSKLSFWSRKGWRKIPGFSSTSSVNKAGLNGE